MKIAKEVIEILNKASEEMTDVEKVAFDYYGPMGAVNLLARLSILIAVVYAFRIVKSDVPFVVYNVASSVTIGVCIYYIFRMKLKYTAGFVAVLFLIGFVKFYIS